MANKNKKFYITTSIAYTNAPPHIGFALESIQADVLARYHRILGEDVFFLTGTDEHGAKIAKAAEEAGQSPEIFVDKISEQFKELKNVLNLSNDDFIRTTDKKRHWPAIKKVWLRLKENGDIYKKKYQGIYCVGCEAFITKKDLIDGKCQIHKQEPQIIEEDNYFFRLSKYAEKIKKAIKEDSIKIIPEARKNEIISFIDEGMEDVSFSRPSKDLNWGILVPDDETQTIYVWADALTNYISALGYEKESETFKKFWPADVHCIGKDILRFHSLIWPGILLSLGLDLPKKIFVHGFITSNGQKMSKSLGNVVDPFELVKKYDSKTSPQAGTDAIRYFLLREIPSTEDGDFSYEKFEARYNADLANGIGNLVARVRKIIENRNLILKIKDSKKPEIKKIISEIKNKYKKSLEEFKFNEALMAIWDLVSFGDGYIDKEKPWENRENSIEVLKDLLFILNNIADLLKPFLPNTAEKIRGTGKFADKKGELLFPRLT